MPGIDRCSHRDLNMETPTAWDRSAGGSKGSFFGSMLLSTLWLCQNSYWKWPWIVSFIIIIIIITIYVCILYHIYIYIILYVYIWHNIWYNVYIYIYISLYQILYHISYYTLYQISYHILLYLHIYIYIYMYTFQYIPRPHFLHISTNTPRPWRDTQAVQHHIQAISVFQEILHVLRARWILMFHMELYIWYGIWWECRTVETTIS